MMRRLALFGLAFLFTATFSAQRAVACGGVFDVQCNLEHGGMSPGNIANQIGQAGQNAANNLNDLGQNIDQARLNLQAETNAPILQAAFEQSRSDARNGGVSPIPPNIRAKLQGFFDSDTLNRASFKIGDNGVLNVASLSVQFGDAAAVTLIDTIVFADAWQAYNDDALWAHELRHVQQFRDWGTHSFSVQYLRSWNGVENDARETASRYVTWRNQQQMAPPPMTPFPQQQPPMSMQYPQVASICMTQYGSCPMGVAIPQGAPCFCTSGYGPIGGVAQ